MYIYYLYDQLNDVVVNGFLKKAIHTLPKLRVVSPDIVVVQHVDRRAEDVVPRCP